MFCFYMYTFRYLKGIKPTMLGYRLLNKPEKKRTVQNIRKDIAYFSGYYKPGQKTAPSIFVFTSCFQPSKLHTGKWAPRMHCNIHLFVQTHTKKGMWQGEFGRSKVRVVRLIVTNARQLFSKGLEPRGLPFPLLLVPITATQTAQREGG